MKQSATLAERFCRDLSAMMEDAPYHGVVVWEDGKPARELNTAYTEMAMERCRADAPLLTSFPPAEPPEDERMGDLFTDMAAD